jgi:transmembrane sensor
VHRPQASRGQEAIQDAQPAVTPEIAAEAAVWVARLHGPDRSNRMERECIAWQARSEANRLAFERCTDTWQDVALVTLSTYATASELNSVPSKRQSAWLQGGMRWALVMAVVVVTWSVLIAQQPWRDVERYSTGVGEQRIVVLRDGSRMSLNTGTRVRVEFASAQRTVGIDGGEALFEVAKEASRPFVVRVGGSEVVALGSVFSVRFTGKTKDVGDLVAVTLIEGRVTVRAASEVAHGLAPPQPLSMTAGERVQIAEAVGAAPRATTQVDRPRIDQVIAWKRNEAVFDDAALADAVSEMNRYSRTPLVLLGTAGLRDLRVSGQFRTGDNVGFARAVAALHGLVAREYPDRLELVPK